MSSHVPGLIPTPQRKIQKYWEVNINGQIHLKEKHFDLAHETRLNYKLYTRGIPRQSNSNE